MKLYEFLAKDYHRGRLRGDVDGVVPRTDRRKEKCLKDLSNR
jgi:hypothetical protein